MYQNNRKFVSWLLLYSNRHDTTSPPTNESIILDYPFVSYYRYSVIAKETMIR